MSGLGGIGRVGTGDVGGVPEPDATAATPAAPPPAATTTPAPARASTTSGAADVWATIARGAAGQPVPPGVNLDASGARRAVALDNQGRFTASPGQNAATPMAVGDGLYAAASLIDDTKDNLFDTIRMPAAGRATMLSNLKRDLATAAPGGTRPAGLTELQALQMRSSGATVLLELMTAKNTPDALKREAFQAYRGNLAVETNPTLKESMALHLDRLRGSLPADLKPGIDQVRDVFAPTKPPYDSWFKNGNDTVKVDWSAGSEFIADNVSNMKKAGFKVVSESYDKTVLEKSMTVNGVKTNFQVAMRPLRSDMFKSGDDPNANMVVYTGHSNWGNNIRSSLQNIPQGSGKDKLFLTDLCVGKGEMQMVKDKFPDAHLVTTFTSSYFTESGDGEEPDSEGMHAILNTFKGIAARRGYEAIAETVRRDNPWAEDHAAEKIDNNFIFPTDVAVRRRALDADHDGQADIFDRLVDFSTFNVAEDTAREFQSVQGPRTADKLVGTKAHMAAMAVNRLTIYSEVFGTVNSDSKVVPGGFFDPKPGDAAQIFRFAKSKDASGKDAVLMQMNSRYAHMSEEALRMAGCFEYNRYMAGGAMRNWRLDAADTNLSGMILASHSLDTDSGYRDDAVWKEFTKAYHLPEIPRGDVERVKEIDHDWYSGSYQSVRELRRGLTPAQVQALSAGAAGRIG